MFIDHIRHLGNNVRYMTFRTVDVNILMVDGIKLQKCMKSLFIECIFKFLINIVIDENLYML